MKITSEERNALKKEIAEEALGRYNLPSTDSALNKVIDTWLTNKGPLMDLLSKNPNWKPDKYMIAFDTSVDREVNMEEVYKFFRAVKNHVKWTCTLESLFYYGCANINKTIAKYAADDYPDLRITEGQKTSKAVNKILTSLGVPEKMGTYVDRRGVKKSYYEKAYADYSDAINPLKIIRHTVISCHPVDYLLMSNGNSWSSCHTINKNDRDSGYSGMRCSGTLSYMLDRSSMVFYHVDASYSGDCLELEPKIIRQMFHYENGVLIQGRLYPQCNDGKNSLYKPTRAIMQKVLADCLELPNLWRKKGGTDICCKFVSSTGTHYPDWEYQSECNVSRIMDMIPEDDQRKVHIGHKPICLECGKEYSAQDYLYCGHCRDKVENTHDDEDGYYCTNCGEWVDEDDVYFINDEPYCEDCVEFCRDCEEYVLRENGRYYPELDAWICDECFERFYTECDYGGICFTEDVTKDVNGYTYTPSAVDELLIEINGEYYREEDTKVCPICGQVYVGDEENCPECMEEIENERDEAV